MKTRPTNKQYKKWHEKTPKDESSRKQNEMGRPLLAVRTCPFKILFDSIDTVFPSQLWSSSSATLLCFPCSF